MDEKEKDSIVNAYFSAAEAMLLLEESKMSGFDRSVVPFPAKDFVLREDTSRFEDARPQGVKRQRTVSVISTRTGQETQFCQADELDAGGVIVGDGAGATNGAVVNWANVEKHQWMLDVLVDLENYASENALPETAEALVTARCELISLSARMR